MMPAVRFSWASMPELSSPSTKSKPSVTPWIPSMTTFDTSDHEVDTSDRKILVIDA
jgi:hypothetical protein